MEGEKGMEVKYYICKHCGNIVEKVKDKGVPVQFRYNSNNAVY